MKDEIWQVEANGQIYEADLGTLKQWIAERAVLPTDKVRFGERKFVQARLVPQLSACFASVETVAPVTSGQFAETAVSSNASSANFNPEVEALKMKIAEALKEKKAENQTNVSPNYAQRRAAQMKKFAGATEIGDVVQNVCLNHPDTAATLICKVCRSTFCKACPKTYGSVKICPNCGEMCEEIEVTPVKKKKNALWQNIGSDGKFGAKDFSRAWAFPFRFTASLFFGALFVAVLSLAGIIGSLFANMIIFGCISQTINQLSKGIYNQDFMPDFSDFSFWDDVLKPVFLSIGVSLVSWLPAILLTVLTFYVGLGSVAESMSSMPVAAETEIAFRPSPEEAEKFGKQRFEQTLNAETGGNFSREEITRRFEEMKNAPKVSETNGASVKGNYKDLFGEMFRANLQSALGKALPFAILALIGLMWGVFYTPMALAIAGYTRSVRTTINPLVGLDTIRRIGFGTYLKALLMILVVQIVALSIGFLIGLVTAPLNLPIIGNLAANFISGGVSFYFSLVIASILGFLLHRKADRLCL